MKERLGLSEMRKQANRMNFAEVSCLMCFDMLIYRQSIKGLNILFSALTSAGP